METPIRYAAYYTPPPGAFADLAGAWLGWDADRGAEPARPDVAGLPRDADGITAMPRKYGFHGTLKAPFRLARHKTGAELADACAALAMRLRPVVFPGLDFAVIGGFLALVPEGDPAPLDALASVVVADLDGFRAPPAPEEIARRTPERLSGRQRALLDRWGYPYVMEEFRFHLTLTGDFSPDEARMTALALRPVLGPVLPRPFAVGAISLCGEMPGGRFRVLHRYALTG